jgi:thiopeptide-type bacteriocin biosynthesis protein
MTDRRWHSVHVHRYVRQDDFLVECVAPMVAALRERSAIDRFFFLRYWRGGHHLRLRFHLAAERPAPVLAGIEAGLRDHLCRTAGAGIDHLPGFEEAQAAMATLEGAEPAAIEPPDTLLTVEYEPELHKYGGDRGVAIAERFFDRSSAVSFEYLRAVSRQPTKRLAAAFAMMVRGARATGWEAPEMAAFFARFCLLWAPYVFDESLASWHKRFSGSQESLRAHVGHVFADDPPADGYSSAVASAWSAVNAHAGEVLPEITLAGAAATAEERGQVLLVSYLHTHNNRLGLVPEQEAFLGYLAHHALSEYAGTEPLRDLDRTFRAVREQRLASVLGKGNDRVAGADLG